MSVHLHSVMKKKALAAIWIMIMTDEIQEGKIGRFILTLLQINNTPSSGSTGWLVELGNTKAVTLTQIYSRRLTEAG